MSFITGQDNPAGNDHGALLGLGDDDHAIYALLAGRAGGQSLVGGTAAGNPLTLRATANGTDGATIFQSDPTTETGRIAPTGEWLIGTTTVATNTPLSVKRDRAGTSQIQIDNANVGNALAGFKALADSGDVQFGHTGTGFSPGFGLVADEAFILGSNSVGLNLNMSTAGYIRFLTTAMERMRILSGANTLQGNDGLKIEGGDAVHALTLSGGAGAASTINIGIASEKIGFFAVTATVRAGATDDIKDALTSYGLLQGTSATALNLDSGTLTGGSVVGTATGGGNISALRSVSTNPSIEIRETGAAADEKSWDFLATSGGLLYRAVNDANSASETYMQVDRTAAAVDSVTFPNGGIVVGSPTGGNKGDGTINAQSVFDDNVLLTDYVFEADYKQLPIDAMRKFYEQNKHLPTIPGRKEWEENGRFSLGKLVNHLWETVEVQARYIAELFDRVKPR